MSIPLPRDPSATGIPPCILDLGRKPRNGTGTRPATSHEYSAGAGAFPSSDHFPLGRPFGCLDSTPEPPSAVRPFGLTLAVVPSAVTQVEPAQLGYDEDAQVGLIREGGCMVPLSRHTTGQTATITDGGDGQNTNQDSDTDQRED